MCGGHFELDWFDAKICLAKILATINFGTHLVRIQKCRPPHKVLVKILAKNLANVLACPSFGKANFSTKPIRLFVQNNETMSKQFM